MDLNYFDLKERSIGIEKLVKAMTEDEFIPKHLKPFVSSLDFQLYQGMTLTPKQRGSAKKIFTIAIESRKQAGMFMNDKDPYVKQDPSLKMVLGIKTKRKK